MFSLVSDMDAVQTIQNDLKFVEDIALRISMDTKSIRNRMLEMQNQTEQERIDAVREIKQNFGLLVEDMASQLNKTANKLNPKKAIDTTSVQKSPMKRVKKYCSSTDDEDTDSGQSSSHRKLSRKTKRRRKIATSRGASAPDSSSNSEDLPVHNIKEEPLIISQDINDLMNGGGASNSANESLTKENDLLGFDQANNAEMHKDIDELLDNETKPSNKSPNHTKKATENSTPADQSMDVTKESSELMVPGEEPQLSTNMSEDLIDNDDDDDEDDDDDDEEIQKYKCLSILYLVFFSIKIFFFPQ